MQHEADCLDEYRRQGLSILEIPPRQPRETFAAWVTRVGSPFDEGYDVIYQMPLVHDGVRGVADFLVRTEDATTGTVVYEPVDAKLARQEAKPGHVLQLCFYADALEAITGHAPRHLHLWLGSGQVEPLVAKDFRPYWNRLKAQLAAALDADPTGAETVPERCSHCQFCEFAERCEAQWRNDDSLIYVADLRSTDRRVLEAGGIATLAALAANEAPVDGVREERLRRAVQQAALQVEARLSSDAPPPYRMIEASDEPAWGRGFESLPEPDDGDVFLDFEGHPFWRADGGLFFLFGFLEAGGDGGWQYRTYWAHDLDEEAEAVRALVGYLAERRAEHPGMHVYHYNHTERSQLERLTASHGVAEIELAELVETGLFVDLFTVAHNAVQVGVESYGLKDLERLAAFRRGHDIDQGAGAVVEYEEYTKTLDAGILERIAAYNEDDVRATRALRDWLIEQRPPGMEWRSAYLEPPDDLPELDEQVSRLHAFGAGTPEYLLGDVRGYWRREFFAHRAQMAARCAGEAADELDASDALAGLEPVGLQAPSGRQKWPAMRFRFPAQSTDGFPSRDDGVVYAVGDGQLAGARVRQFDLGDRVLDLVWNEKSQEAGVVPSLVVIDDSARQTPKSQALSALAAQVLDPTGGAPNEVSMALLRRDLPAFVPGGGPAGGRFSDDLDEMADWVRDLDHSYLTIQGPPGTGKTYRGAHIVRDLILAGRRVGITAMSHHAIDNLLEASVALFAENGLSGQLNAIKRQPAKRPENVSGVAYEDLNPPCAEPGYNLVAGTTWLFANDCMRDAPVDVLIVDEAGQLALADALAASRAAKSMVLLGDPLQLAQVEKASHPGGGGASVLEHVLGEDVTVPADRGIFLAESRRMHPDVCSFISDEIYEGRLTSHPSCWGQRTSAGTGLRWMEAHHSDRSNEAPEEAELVASEISRLLGTPWVNQHGTEAPLSVGDVMVVAPYNNQVNLIRQRLDRDTHTRNVPVGTVDKFQGREAAVVFFTMTSSSSDDASRGPDFLFSRNRLNVAVSRARCLAYLVCTKELLDSRARSVDEMRLLSTLCSFVEHADAAH
nr:TM0106 family RecB-like putative nuclease [Rhabdothermincola salaria]